MRHFFSTYILGRFYIKCSKTKDTAEKRKRGVVFSGRGVCRAPHPAYPAHPVPNNLPQQQPTPCRPAYQKRTPRNAKKQSGCGRIQSKKNRAGKIWRLKMQRNTGTGNALYSVPVRDTQQTVAVPIICLLNELSPGQGPEYYASFRWYGTGLKLNFAMQVSRNNFY
jgi:hypothetical protein